jgi:hypothetical protein
LLNETIVQEKTSPTAGRFGNTHTTNTKYVLTRKSILVIRQLLACINKHAQLIILAHTCQNFTSNHIHSAGVQQCIFNISEVHQWYTNYYIDTQLFAILNYQCGG